MFKSLFVTYIFILLSADIWIPASTCPASTCPLARFNSQSSSTFTPLAEKLDIQYGIGTAKGTYGLDTITIGSASLMNHSIGLVNDTTNLLFTSTTTEPSNGILGLGFPDLSMKTGNKSTHIITDLYASKAISAPIFSVFLNSPFELGYAGEFTIGGIDSSRYTGDIQYAPVVSFDFSQYYISPNLGVNKTTTAAGSNTTYLYWTVPGQGISTSNGYTYNAPHLEAFILDTGTTLTYVPPKVAENIVSSAIKNTSALNFDSVNGVYIVDCGLPKKSNATVSFLISPSDTEINTTAPIQIEIPISDLVLPLDDALTPATSKNCMFGIAPSPTGLDLTSGDTYILGETTLRAFYAIFDLQQKRVGIARLASNASTSSSTSETSQPAKSTSSINSGKSNNTSSASLASYPTSTLFLFTAIIIAIMNYA